MNKTNCTVKNPFSLLHVLCASSKDCFSAIFILIVVREQLI